MKWESKGSANQFVKEIAWREFYYAILFHRPEVETTSFNPQYTNLKWENNQKYFTLFVSPAQQATTNTSAYKMQIFNN